jgi:hypothetical protein
MSDPTTPSELSDEPSHPGEWPPIPPTHPTAAWHAVAQDRIDGLRIDTHDIRSTLRRMEERQQRGGPATRVALKLIDAMTSVAQSPNMKWIAAVIIGLAVLAWGGAISWGDLTIGSAGAERPAAHPSPSPVPSDIAPQELP